MGRKLQSVLTGLWNKLFCLGTVTAASRLWWKHLTFHTLCLTCLQEREYFLIISQRHSFCVTVWIFSSAHCDSCVSRHDVTVFVYCVSCLHVYVYQTHNFSFLLNIYMWDCNVFVCFFPFLRKMAKSRKEYVIDKWWFCAFRHWRKYYFSVYILSYA